ncbi:hypothetical protein ACWCXE_16535 [Streptomyces sp. NPDC001780]
MPFRDVRVAETAVEVPGAERFGARSYELYRRGVRSAGDGEAGNDRSAGRAVVVDIECEAGTADGAGTRVVGYMNPVEQVRYV